MYYKNLYATNNSKISKDLFDVNKQIASGLKIEYAHDDVDVFAKTMRLDNELSSLSLVKKSTESGYKMSNQADSVLNEFDTTMDRMRTLLVNAANGSHSETSLDAIADELEVLEEHLKNLSNTSINGEYLFSGTAIDTRPISEDGKYMGNDGVLNSALGSNITQQYNISGAELFLGEEVLTKREITTNVANENLSVKYSYETKTQNDTAKQMITQDDTIRDLMGDIDSDIDTTNKHHFYIRGTRSDGTAFKEKVDMKDDDKVQELLEQIGNFYGNKPNLKVVDVSLNAEGQIVIKDKQKGSSKLDFHMVGAVDFDHSDDTNGDGKVDDADVDDIDLLDGGEKDFAEIMNPTTPPANNLYVKEFVVSGLDSAPGAASNIEGIVYDRANFKKDGSTLSSSVSQVLKSDNSFVKPSTKLSEVADLSQGSSQTLDGTHFTLSGKTIYGTDYDISIDLSTSGSTFSPDGGATNYKIFDMGDPRDAVDADEMTYQQLLDVINMVVTDNLPASTDSADDYDDAIKASKLLGDTTLTYDGKIQFKQTRTNDTKASIALYDKNTNDFSTSTASVMTFNANNTLTIKDAKTNFFKSMDEIVASVREYKLYPDAQSGDARNIGIENSIGKLDDLQEHLNRVHSKVGAQSNALSVSLERTELLEISTMTLRSSTVDTDLAEASLKLAQLNTNYEAMLSTVGRVSKLSLVNYL
jgi:flagellar hook-associated protein 3 FlgL